jgi:transposase-like protein
MALLSYRRHRFPPPIIQHAIWLFLRFTLSYRDVEDLLAERGLDVSYERWPGAQHAPIKRADTLMQDRKAARL